MSKDLDKFLNIAPGETLPAVIEQKKTTQVDADFEYARENMMEVINKGQEALFDLMDVARQSQHPRAYEVAANMMKNLSDMTEKLMVLQKQRKELEKDNPQAVAGPTNINVDKAVFVGSTADLLKQIKEES